MGLVPLKLHGRDRERTHEGSELARDTQASTTSTPTAHTEREVTPPSALCLLLFVVAVYLVLLLVCLFLCAFILQCIFPCAVYLFFVVAI